MYNLDTHTISCPYLGRLCPYLGGACPYLGGACPYLGSEPYEAKLIIKNRFFPEKHFGSTTALDKVIFGYQLTHLIAISNHNFFKIFFVRTHIL